MFSPAASARRRKRRRASSLREPSFPTRRRSAGRPGRRGRDVARGRHVVEAVADREGRVRLVKRDVDETAVSEGRRALDQRDVVAKEQVRRVQSAGVVLRRGRFWVVGRSARRGVVRRAVRVEGSRQVVARARGVVGVAAVVGRDPVERGDLVRGEAQVVLEAVGRVVQVRDVVRVAVRVGRSRGRSSRAVVFRGCRLVERRLRGIRQAVLRAARLTGECRKPRRGKCFATYWSAGSPLPFAPAGWAPV